MNEISQILEPKEKVIYESKPNYAPFMINAFFVSLTIMVILGVLLFFFANSLILAVVIAVVILVTGLVLANMAYSRTHYAITNKRAIIQSGIIGRDFRSIDYDRMQNVSVEVGILGVIFKVGTVKIFTGEMETVGGDRPRMQAKYDKFNYIPSPYDVLKMLQTHLSLRKEELR